tara:strand:- start:6121 stop:6276 length:156 start_codon:yes stop_codon:yes gene_type:complete
MMRIAKHLLYVRRKAIVMCMKGLVFLEVTLAARTLRLAANLGHVSSKSTMN